MQKRTALVAALADTIARHATPDADTRTPVERLFIGHRSGSTPPAYTLQWPCLTLVVQGAKTITVGTQRLRYDAGDYLLVTRDLPVSSRTVEGSPTRPQLGLALAIDPTVLTQLLARAPLKPTLGEPAPALAVRRADEDLLDALRRLLALLDRPRDIPALAPLHEQEVLYRVLTGPLGPALVRIASDESQSTGVGRALAWLRAHYTEPLRIEDLAHHAGMSVSSLHHRFKAATSLTPLQVQKHLRLHEARRLILVDQLDVGTAGFRVGYQTHAQFSREYRRLYGNPPADDLRRHRPREAVSRRV
ncbi:AraC family transcriptional regulator [Chondromyces crocatus]|uniref:AraC family transcriptional regulator n=1 Tax=Chondromyces crocatus TaxID=52 RepID=A0A0K1EBF1_CHOCO|nr:AraC family transcriptional regulator [Chondromyces crocatus]AKT38174.1 AraC family transcriptional regulator [Chondromyces crocatus]